jgi:tetratricopeptide (TPR) repeat protein
MFLSLREFCLSTLFVSFILMQCNVRTMAQTAQQPSEQQFKDMAVEIVALSHTPETDAGLALCREGVGPIPLSVQRQIAAAGIKVVLTPRTIYDEPENSGAGVFTNGGTFDNAGGFFESSKNRVLVPERAAWRNSPPRFQGRYIVTVVRHELGHALDHACGSISQQADYISCYKDDLHRLSSDQKIEFAYYITGVSKEKSEEGTPSGRGELFASTFCALCTKPPTLRDTKLLDSFPSVKNYILNLEPDLKNIDATSRPIVKQKKVVTAGAVENTASNPDTDRAVVLIQTGYYSDALRLLNEVLKTSPGDYRAHLLRGNSLSWLGRHREAIADYNVAIGLNSELADAYMMRGRAYGWLGQKLDQKRDEETAHRISIRAVTQTP